MYVKIESSKSSPSKSDTTHTNQSHTTCIAVQANAQHEAAKCATCHEKQEFSFCLPIKVSLWCITLEAIVINMRKYKRQPELRLDHTATT